MRVIFEKSDDRPRCSWRAELPGRRRVQGSTMAARSAHTDLPHDLAQLVVEAGLDLDHGFWNLVANGATFQSLGRRPTKPGRQLIAAYRAGEDTARRLGHQRLALGVGVDNPGARRLYERLGYADRGHGIIVGTWFDRDRAGPVVRVSERLHMLVKPLSGHGLG